VRSSANGACDSAAPSSPCRLERARFRTRSGETLVTDGPYAETKEFVAGYDILECADLDEATTLVARNPATRIGSIEIRAFA
jgi:hypothetical protein